MLLRLAFDQASETDRPRFKRGPSHMALITCAECGAEASTSAKQCPGCGASPKVMAPRSALPNRPWFKKKRHWLIGIFGGAALLGSALEKQRSPAETKEDRISHVRDLTASLALFELKKSMRNPQSFQVEKLSSDKDGSLLCIIYRAQNGFGGLNVGHATVLDTEISTTDRSWNKRCAHKRLYDLTDIIEYLPPLPGQK